MNAEYVVPLIVVTVVVSDLVTAAPRRANMQAKELAIDLGWSAPALSHALDGDKSINLHRLVQADPRFLRAFGEALIEAAGGEPPLTRTALRQELDRLMVEKPSCA